MCAGDISEPILSVDAEKQTEDTRSRHGPQTRLCSHLSAQKCSLSFSLPTSVANCTLLHFKRNCISSLKACTTELAVLMSWHLSWVHVTDRFKCGTEFVTLSVEQCFLRNYINSTHLSFQTVQSAMPISCMFMLHLSYMYVYGQCMHLWLIPQISKPQRALAQVLFSESDVERLRHQIRDLYISFDCF